MLELRLRYQGGGTFVCAGRTDLEAAEKAYQPDRVVFAKCTTSRSLRQNNLFHALIDDAFHNQRAGPRMDTVEHMKAHVLIAIGYCDKFTFKPDSLTAEVAAELRKNDSRLEFTVHEETGDIIMRRRLRTRDASAETMRWIIDKADEYISTVLVPGLKKGEAVEAAKGKAA